MLATPIEKGSVKSKVLHSAIKMFLSQGYQNTTMREIAKNAGVNYGSLTFAFKSKESIVCELVGLVFDKQFEKTDKLLQGVTTNKILKYAFETTLQLYIAESDENMREMYNVSYSMPKSTQVIYNKITNKLQDVFGEHLPNYQTKDFYELEIASAGIMRNFLSVPCDMYFTMERKVKRFLETTFLVYKLPQSVITEAINFVSKFDFVSIAKETKLNMLSYIESRI